MQSPVDAALVYPRRKAGQANLGRGTQAVLLTKSDLEKLMHLGLGLGKASKQLGLCKTTVKKVCRTLGIYQWEKAASSRAQSQFFFDNRPASASPAHSRSEEASYMAPASGVASDPGLSISYTVPTATAQERADDSTSTSASSSSTVDGGRGADPSEALRLTP